MSGIEKFWEATGGRLRDKVIAPFFRMIGIGRGSRS